MRRRVVVIAAAVIAAGIAVAVLTAPRYETVTVGGVVLRMDRETGETRMLDADKGWVLIPDSAPAYRPGWKLVRDSTPITAVRR